MRTKFIWNISLAKVEKILSWIICSQLKFSLVLSLIVRGDIIWSWNSNRFTVFITLINLFVDTFTIISWDPSILHEFDRTSWQARSSLRSIIHDSERSIRIDLFHRNSWVDWIVIVWNIAIKISVIQVLLEIPSWSIV